MAALTVALAITVVLLLIALATASLLAYGYATALAATTAERDEAIAGLRQRDIATAALDSNALPTRAARDLDLCRRIWAASTADHDTQES